MASGVGIEFQLLENQKIQCDKSYRLLKFTSEQCFYVLVFVFWGYKEYFCRLKWSYIELVDLVNYIQVVFNGFKEKQNLNGNLRL